MKLTKTKANGMALFFFLFTIYFLSLSSSSQAASPYKKFQLKSQHHISEENLPPNPSGNDIAVIQMDPGFSQIFPNDPNTFPQKFKYSLEENAANGTISIRGSKFFYTAKPGFIGNDYFTVKVTDDGTPSLSGIKKVNVTVLPNNIPIVDATNLTTFQSKSVTTQVSFTDADANQAHSFLIITQPAHGSAQLTAQGLLTYSPLPGYAGIDYVTVAVRDTAIPAGVGKKTISISITQNSIPVVVANDFSTLQNKSASTQISYTDVDVNQRHTFFIVAKPSNGTALLNQEGVLTYTPKLGYLGPDTLIVGVSDNAVPSGIGQKTIHVNVGS